MEQHGKKSRHWALPWLIAGVLIILLLAYLAYLGGRKTEVVKQPIKQETPLAPSRNIIVAAYIAFIDTGENRMSLDHHFTKEALNKLASAMQAIADVNNFRQWQHIDSVNIYADRITEDKYAVSHADDIRRAANIVSAAFTELQQAKYPNLSLAAAEVYNAAAKIDPDRLTLDQRTEVKEFFRSCADLLRKMN